MKRSFFIHVLLHVPSACSSLYMQWSPIFFISGKHAKLNHKFITDTPFLKGALSIFSILFILTACYSFVLPSSPL